MSDTVAILVNWKSAANTLAALASLRAQSAGAPVLIVIDNGSGDGSLARLAAEAPDAILIDAGRNLGFGPACNLGIARAKAIGARKVWFFNNDAEAEAGTLGALERTLESDPRIAAVGSVILRAGSDTIDFWGGARINFFTGQPEFVGSAARLTYITGASMLARMEALESVGGFDESYFLYWEDADLCFRLKRAGWRLAVAGDSRVHHASSASASKAGIDLVRYYNAGAKRFYRRYAPIPAIPIAANFLYRFLGQLRAGNRAHACALVRVTFGLDDGKGPRTP